MLIRLNVDKVRVVVRLWGCHGGGHHGARLMGADAGPLRQIKGDFNVFSEALPAWICFIFTQNTQ